VVGLTHRRRMLLSTRYGVPAVSLANRCVWPFLHATLSEVIRVQPRLRLRRVTGGRNLKLAHTDLLI